ncbi:MAG: 16S rRNA (cytosine(967)-C(5))-methyltransferase, partial [Lachnospiraceae bacterium]|nr:16S rRNA (cytosine(967)-C(5))-methyltransferase [Lachnospiraceae bacterium]
MSARNTVLDNLINILEEKKPLHIVLSQSLDRQSEEQDNRFISRLTRACVERALTLDTILNSYSSV